LTMPAELMSTREVAEYLRLKERKVYDLVARRRIPCTRVSGKWLFPKALIDAWLLEQAAGVPGQPELAELPNILAGSHDPLLDWAVRESGSDLAILFDGSLAGLERLAERRAMACGVHVIDAESESYNLPQVRARLGKQPVVVLEWAWREQGLIVAAGNPLGIACLADLPRVRFAARQREAGSHLLLEHLLRTEALPAEAVRAEGPPLRSESEVALAVSEGRADAGLGIAAVARQLGLGFVPLKRERYDLVVWRRAYFEPPLQHLMAFTRSAAFRDRALQFAGYDVDTVGRVHFNGP
jgi:putative molybdopterin biosynthesis protein